MTREDLMDRIVPLTVFEQKKKKAFEETGRLFGGELTNIYKKDKNGEYVLSNEKMSAMRDISDDEIHRTFFPPSLRRKLRLILHSRYAEIPFHHTEFVSIHYVLNGHLVIHFRDRRVILQAGQLILMNAGIAHSLFFEGEQDIVLGIQIEKEFLGYELLYGIRGSGTVADFLVDEITGENNSFSYIITGFENDIRVRNLFEDMFCEAIDVQLDSAVMIENYMRLLLMSIIRATSSSSVVKTNSRADIAGILAYIEEHYPDCTLSGLAAEIHFNEKYLGNLIHRKTGKTFSSILESVRLQRAAFYLEGTALSVQKIAAMCGYSNMTFFFRRFRETYHLTPAEYRTEMRGE
ncbi:MAG: AraC family transcriptional regulator [Bilifractor sp.]